MIELKISGMSCQHCQHAVLTALKAVPGVKNAEVNLTNGKATVEGQVDLERLIQAVENEGYQAALWQLNSQQ